MIPDNTAKIITEALNEDRLIVRQTDDVCEFCGKLAELRPYGPNEERVCFPCAMLDEDAARAALGRRLG